MKKVDFLEHLEDNSFEGFFLAGDRARAGGTRFQESLTRFTNLIADNHTNKHVYAVRLMEAATTSDFPALLGTMLDFQLAAKYKALPADMTDWKSYLGTGTQSDFRPNKLIAGWGLETPLSRVPQHGEYPEGKMTEGGTGITIQKYGKTFGLTFEDIINDRWSVFSDISGMLSRAAGKTELRFATSMYAIATGPNPALFGTTGSPVKQSIDGTNIVNMKTNFPLTPDNLAAGIAYLRNQRDATGEPIFFSQVHLVVAPANEFNMKRILSPAALVVNSAGVSANSKQALVSSANVLNQYSITPHVNPYLPILDTSGNADGTWYLFVDKADGVAAQVNYLRGHETPETFMKASNQTSTSGGAVDVMQGSFEDDTIWWKVRHIFGGAPIDQRMCFAAVNATPGL